MKNNLKRLILFLAVIASIGAVGCTDEDVDSENTGKPESNGKKVDGKAEAWDATNDPQRFEINFVYDYEQLAAYTVGRAEQVPWPSDYWSYYQDSINVRFHGPNELSPVEKYDKAYHNWQPDMTLTPVNLQRDCGEDGTIADTHDAYYDHLGPAAAWQHRNKGNWKSRNGQDDDRDGTADECRAGEDGKLDYDGIETWWGLCHAWAPAAILEPEPLHPVTVNGVEFTVSDIKALLINQYDRTSARMLGGRCNALTIERDETGRITRDECRDTNAGSFFVVATNMLGKDKRAFAEDRTAGYQVWNQPVLGYQITKQTELTEEEALATLGKATSDGTYAELFDSPDVVSWRFVKMNVDYITEASNSTEGALTPNIENWTRTDYYQMVIELDADGKVVGGEWIGYSQDTHPDFLWLPTRGNGGNPSVNTSNIRRILDLSRKSDDPDPNENVVEFGGDVTVAIPDNDPNGVTHTLTVTDDVTIGSLRVKLSIEHTFIGDLRVVLSKDGTDVVLHDRTGSGTNDIYDNYKVDKFDGTSAKGTWTLNISDLGEEDTGTLKNFTLSVASSDETSTSERIFENEEGGDIPDDDETGLTSVINVTEEGTIKGLKVNVDITHTYIGDLTLVLEHGSSRQVLHSREGGSSDDIQKTFVVQSFNGTPIQGDWSLTVKDEVEQDIGALNKWSIVAEL